MTTPAPRPPRPGGPATARSARPTRRQLARGIAWATPTVVASTAAPAFAASGCVPVTGTTLTQQLSFGGAYGANGWTGGGSGTYYDTATRPAFQASYTQNGWNGGTYCEPSYPAPTNSLSFAPAGGVIGGIPDPSSAGARLTYTRTLCLGPGTYTIAYDWVSLTYNRVTSTLQLTATRANGPTVAIGSAVTTPVLNASSNQFGSGTVSGTLTVPSANTYTFVFGWTFSRASTYLEYNSCSTFADDIVVSSPRVG